MRSINVMLGTMVLLASTALASPISYVATLTGAAESPPTGSPGIGAALVTFDLTAHTLAVSASFSGLTSNTTASHIHCCTAVPFTGTAGVATTTPSFVGFPLGVTAGSFSMTYDTTAASTYNPAFVTAQGSIANAEAALAAGLAAGTTYYNIHTTQNPGGEIRGFLTQTPEPGTWAMAAAALAGLVLRRRRRET